MREKSELNSLRRYQFPSRFSSVAEPRSEKPVIRVRFSGAGPLFCTRHIPSLTRACCFRYYSRADLAIG